MIANVVDSVLCFIDIPIMLKFVVIVLPYRSGRFNMLFLCSNDTGLRSCYDSKTQICGGIVQAVAAAIGRAAYFGSVVPIPSARYSFVTIPEYLASVVP